MSKVDKSSSILGQGLPFIVEDSPLCGAAVTTELEPGEEAQVLMEAGKEPVIPGIPPQSGKPRFVPAELWVMIRGLAEGRRFEIASIAALTGVSKETIHDKATREGWHTAERIKNANKEKIDTVLDGVFSTVTSFVEENSKSSNLAPLREGRPDKLLDEAIDEPAELEIQQPGEELRAFLDTPPQLRPKPQDLLPKKLSPAEHLKRLESLRTGMASELAKRSELHQLGIAEISQHAIIYLSHAVQQDPALAVLFADRIEKLDKIGRRNFRLDTTDPLAGAKNVIIMSDPGFIPKPAMSNPNPPDPENPVDPNPTFEIEDSHEP
jgi:hypothetical protein